VRISVTGIARYRRCPLQYRYAHVDGIPGRMDDPVRGVGNAAHAALEYAFHPDGPPPDGAELVKRFAAELHRHRVAGTVHARQALAQAEERFPALVQRTVKSGVRPVAVEQAFTLRVGPHTVMGRIDRIDALPVGGVGLVDYKTGSRPPSGPAEEDGRMVLRVYMAGVRETWRVEPRVATLEYVLDGGVTPENPDAGEMGQAMDQARDALDGIAAGQFPPRPGWVCRSCDYQLLCPARDR
jgi:DNA helicase-2/ATP-dependent DNA helicase PcrA